MGKRGKIQVKEEQTVLSGHSPCLCWYRVTSCGKDGHLRIDFIAAHSPKAAERQVASSGVLTVEYVSPCVLTV